MVLTLALASRVMRDPHTTPQQTHNQPGHTRLPLSRNDVAASLLPASCGSRAIIAVVGCACLRCVGPSSSASRLPQRTCAVYSEPAFQPERPRDVRLRSRLDPRGFYKPSCL